MEKRIDLLDPQVLTKLSNLSLVARNVVEGFISGLHRSFHKGFSIEFSEHREYVPGDDLRYIDWKVFARTDRLYVKVFREETNLRSYILLDASNSMSFASNGLTKLQYGVYLAASLSYLMINQKDAAGLVVFDSGIRTFVKPASTMSHLHNIMEALQAVGPGKETSLGKVLNEVATHGKKRGLVILISDLLDDPESVMKGLAHFKHRHHDVVVFHVLDPAEIFLSMDGSHEFIDMETGERLSADVLSMRKTYRESIKEYLSFYRRKCAEKDIGYALADTSTPFDRFLSAYLERRAKLK